MTQIRITADTRQVERLGKNYAGAAAVGMGRLVERGEQLVRDEAPKRTRNLIQGVSSDVKVLGGGSVRGEIIITARSGRRDERTGTLHLPGGKTREVRLRPVPAFNYPQAVAEGTGVYATGGEFGPKPVVSPKAAKVLLIPVDGVPTLNGKPESYITADGQTYVLRRWTRGMKPNPYHERAARRLEPEAGPIFGRALQDVIGGRA
jgi:hypothetical protein